MLSYTVNYSGLTGDATMAHIHGTAAKGANSGVKRDLTPMLKMARLEVLLIRLRSEKK
jgi:hypothetical protein